MRFPLISIPDASVARTWLYAAKTAADAWKSGFRILLEHLSPGFTQDLSALAEVDLGSLLEDDYEAIIDIFDKSTTQLIAHSFDGLRVSVVMADERWWPVNSLDELETSAKQLRLQYGSHENLRQSVLIPTRMYAEEGVAYLDEIQQELERLSKRTYHHATLSDDAPIVRDPLNEARDKLIYIECCKGTPYKQIMQMLSQRRDWHCITTIPGIRYAGKEFAKRHGGELPRRQQERKSVAKCTRKARKKAAHGRLQHGSS